MQVFIQPLRLWSGNYVWYDEDADGIQDPTGGSIPGVLVTLYDNTNTPVSVQ
ncbi:MAG: hypothetical protein IPN26_05345 [Bacteroidetes bacterium]|nr:hypothetical protein [Bacteroidota bacterium]